MKCSVFVGTSVDGFIARKDGRFDFLPPGGGEPHGYDEFIASVDVVVFGRHTFDVVLKLPEWPFDKKKRIVVLSSRTLDLSSARGAVEQMNGTPEEVAARLEASGAKHAYIDGGVTVQRFLRSGLIQKMVITRVPVLIGEGIPLFGSLPRDVRLKHVATRQYKSGMVQSEYEVEGARA